MVAASNGTNYSCGFVMDIVQLYSSNSMSGGSEVFHKIDEDILLDYYRLKSGFYPLKEKE